MTKSFKYKAFISYSHQDKKWGDWLHKNLENFRIPKGLVGKETKSGVVPKRLFPIFRDREELPTSHELGKVIGQALRDSSHLVVICSPAICQVAMGESRNQRVQTTWQVRQYFMPNCGWRTQCHGQTRNGRRRMFPGSC